MESRMRRLFYCTCSFNWCPYKIMKCPIKLPYVWINVLAIQYSYFLLCLGVWGELVNHERSSTHCPSSQGWAPRCPSHFVFVCLYFTFGVLGPCFLPFFSSSTTACVLYTCSCMCMTGTCVHVQSPHSQLLQN